MPISIVKPARLRKIVHIRLQKIRGNLSRKRRTGPEENGSPFFHGFYRVYPTRPNNESRGMPPRGQSMCVDSRRDVARGSLGVA